MLYNSGMGLKICSFASSSDGNCVFVAGKTGVVLIDIGISPLRVEKCLKVLGYNGADAAVAVTHSHIDHIAGIAAFAKKYGTVVYGHHESNDYKLHASCKNYREFSSGFEVGDLYFEPIILSHDVPCVGYNVFCGDAKISVMTDLGIADGGVVDAARGCGILFVEANHDREMLLKNPNYPYQLKRRILSERGHLSNAESAAVCSEIVKSGARQIILAHLSAENNYPELAFKTVAKRLAEDGMKEGADISIEVAPPDRMSGLFELEIKTGGAIFGADKNCGVTNKKYAEEAV
jgi:phosphoribosyl 1,2-cyclic phosphodiesterase